MRSHVYGFIVRCLMLVVFAGVLSSSQPVFAACGAFDTVSGYYCEVVRGQQCPDNPTRCCNPASECSTQGGGSPPPPASGGTNPPPPSGGTGQGSSSTGLCDFVESSKRSACLGCAGGGTWTAIGCIPTTTSGILQKFLSLGIGMAGGIAFLLILFGGFQIITSTGNPEQLNAGREMVASAIAGLLLIIFSLFLLRLIGYNVLGIPGFR